MMRISAYFFQKNIFFPRKKDEKKTGKRIAADELN